VRPPTGLGTCAAQASGVGDVTPAGERTGPRGRCTPVDLALLASELSPTLLPFLVYDLLY
jgi:hypothetical protein